MSGIRRRTLFGALGIGFLSLAVWSQISDIDSGVDSFVQAAMQQQRIPGLALAVMRDGEFAGFVELSIPIPDELPHFDRDVPQ